MFTHNSSDAVINFKAPAKQPVDKKPAGLWFAQDNAWIEFARRESITSAMHDDDMLDDPASKGSKPWDIRPYHHNLELDMSKILVLDSAEKIYAFNEEFTYSGTDRQGQMKAMLGQGIDWAKVAQKHDGIFIPEKALAEMPPLEEMPMELLWVASYDVGSGCVWNKDAIKECKLCTPEQLAELGVDNASMAEKVTQRPSQWSTKLGG